MAGSNSEIHAEQEQETLSVVVRAMNLETKRKVSENVLKELANCVSYELVYQP